MLFGPTYIYKCPKCETLYQQQSLASGNTMGAIFFSDGNYYAPMMPDFPHFTSCLKCNTLFWLNNKALEGSYELDETPINDWKNATLIPYPTLDNLKTAIKSTIYVTEDEERYLRLKLWRLYNQNNLNDRTFNFNSFEEKNYTENALHLIKLLSFNNENERLLIAEMYRNLEQFEKCIEIVNTIQDKKFKPIAKQLKEKCLKGIKYVFELT